MVRKAKPRSSRHRAAMAKDPFGQPAKLERWTASEVRRGEKEQVRRWRVAFGDESPTAEANAMLQAFTRAEAPAKARSDKPAVQQRRKRGPAPVWAYVAEFIAPRMDRIVDKEGRFPSWAAASRRLIELLKASRKKPPHLKTCVKRIKREYLKWVAPEGEPERLRSNAPRRQK
jgi:hypothetical protein